MFKRILRHIKAKLHGVSNYKEVLDWNGNLQMYCGSVKAPSQQQIQMIFNFRGYAGNYIEQILDSFHKRHLIQSYEIFGKYEDEGSISIFTIKSNKQVVRKLLASHFRWSKNV